MQRVHQRPPLLQQRILIELKEKVGEAIWRGPLSRIGAQRALLQQGIVPILARMYIEATDEHVPATKRIDISGGYALAHDAEGDCHDG